jgi:hypothetical protein
MNTSRGHTCRDPLAAFLKSARGVLRSRWTSRDFVANRVRSCQPRRKFLRSLRIFRETVAFGVDTDL